MSGAAEQYITRTLGDAKTVTFRQVSRQVGCHVHAAKNYLAEYYATHPDVVPTYLLSGPLLSTSTVARTSINTDAPPQGTQSLAHMSATQKIRIVDMDQISDDERNSEADAEEERAEIELEQSGEESFGDDHEPIVNEEVPKWGVVLTNEEVLEDKKKLFAQANIHIYALSANPIKDGTVYLACALNVREHGSATDTTVYGTITGQALVAGTKPMADGSMKFGVKKKEANVEVGPKVKTEVKPDVKEEESKTQLAPRKSSNKRRVIVSDDEDDVPPSSTKAASTSKSSNSKLEPTASMVRADDQAAMVAMMGMDFDVDDDDDDDDTQPVGSTKPVPSTKPVASKSSSDSKRKRRRVKKSKVEMDDKGYMVTKDYYTDVSHSGSETETEAASASSSKPGSRSKPVPPPKPKAAAPPAASGKKPPTKKASMGQSTLAGFFKKK